MKELFQSEVKKIQALRPIDTRNDRKYNIPLCRFFSEFDEEGILIFHDFIGEKFIRLYKGCVEIRKECGHCEENFGMAMEL